MGEWNVSSRRTRRVRVGSSIESSACKLDWVGGGWAGLAYHADRQHQRPEDEVGERIPEVVGQARTKLIPNVGLGKGCHGGGRAWFLLLRRLWGQPFQKGKPQNARERRERTVCEDCSPRTNGNDGIDPDPQRGSASQAQSHGHLDARVSVVPAC